MKPRSKLQRVASPMTTTTTARVARMARKNRVEMLRTLEFSCTFAAQHANQSQKPEFPHAALS